jgi:peptide/nickel transport system substrate-binding protein
MMMKVFAGILFSIAALATAAASAQNLSLAIRAPVTSIDPHYHNVSPNQSMASHLFDALTDMDATAHVVPGLAESWRRIDDQTWEFKLRQGVKFHNGVEFTADDVAFTLDRVPKVPNSPSSYGIYTKAVTKVEVVDKHTVRLHTAGVYPLLPIDLSLVAMLSRKIHAGATTDDFNTGKAAIGTGPFRFVSFQRGDRIELDRNDDYWGKKPAWKHVTLRILSNDATRAATLLSGDVAMMDAVPTSMIAKLRTDPKIKLWETVGLRVIFISMDFSREGPTPFITGPNGEALDRNPLKDKRVREALSLGIDRTTLVNRTMEGVAIPTGQVLPPGAFGYIPERGVPPHDVARAKALLAAAGYPNGFKLTLHGPNDRYVNDAQIIQTVGAMWARIGVQTSVVGLPWAVYAGRAGKQEFSVFLFGWGVATGEASDALRGLIATWDPAKGLGSSNRGRYSNPAFDAVLAQAMTTADDPAREKLFQKATAMAMEDVAIVPLFIEKNVWASRADITYTPRAHDQTRAAEVRPAK